MTVSIEGMGAVSPAGWNVDALRDALAKGEPLPTRFLPRPGWTMPLPVRTVPRLQSRPEFLNHGRLRRTSPISQFAVSAALEALGSEAQKVREGSLRLGIIFAVMSGCVGYTRRFYSEALADPATASPLVFPETVFNAPASHLASYLGSSHMSYTLVGDPGMFLAGLNIATNWLCAGRVDACLVVGAEEIDWIVADAARRFSRHSVLSEGAGALYLRLSDQPQIVLSALTDAHSFLQARGRTPAAEAMYAELPRGEAGHLLCDGLQGIPVLDRTEARVVGRWPGLRLSPKRVLGEGLAAGSAWQCVAAVDALQQGHTQAAGVTVVGCNQQAIGAMFVRRS